MSKVHKPPISLQSHPLHERKGFIIYLHPPFISFGCDGWKISNPPIWFFLKKKEKTKNILQWIEGLGLWFWLFFLFFFLGRRTILRCWLVPWRMTSGFRRFRRWKWQLWDSRREQGRGFSAGGECLTFDQLAPRAPLGQNTVWLGFNCVSVITCFIWQFKMTAMWVFFFLVKFVYKILLYLVELSNIYVKLFLFHWKIFFTLAFNGQCIFWN